MEINHYEKRWGGVPRPAIWRRGQLVLVLAIARLVVSCGGDSSSKPPAAPALRVAAAANVVAPLVRIHRAFTQKTGQPVELIIGASGKLSAQIQQGAPYHLLVSADLDFPQQLLALGQARAPLLEYARGRLVLWSHRPRDLGMGLAILDDPEVQRIALANPATAPYGRAAKSLLLAQGHWARLQSKLVFGESIAQTNQYIQSGSCQLGLTAQSAVIQPGMPAVGSWMFLDTLLYPPLAQAAIGTRYGYRTQPATVQAYLQFLTSPLAREIWQSYGYLPPAPVRPGNH